MADYVRQHDFSVKDALTTGDPDKVIKGSEVDEELDAILTAVGTKVDKTTGHTTNNLASLNSIGNIEDSGLLKTDIAELSGATFTGALTLSGAPTSDLHAATKAYVDTKSAGATITLMNPSAAATVGSPVAHGLGAVPVSVMPYIECLTADAGFSPGDTVSAGSIGLRVQTEFDATNITAITGPSISVYHHGTAASTTITYANWKIMARVVG